MAFLLLIAHDIGLPHEEMARQADGNASTALILAVVVASALVLGALLLIRRRMG